MAEIPKIITTQEAAKRLGVDEKMMVDIHKSINDMLALAQSPAGKELERQYLESRISDTSGFYWYYDPLTPPADKP